jgi:NitT/TauT family transport system substrate-binding protein
MTTSRRAVIGSGAALAALAALGNSPLAVSSLGAQELRRARLAIGLKLLNSTFLNVMIGERLGYTRHAGFTLEGMALGALSSVLVALDKGDAEFGIVSPSVALPLVAKGEWPPIAVFYEYTYPYKWDVAVKPDSPLKTYQDLRGKKIGVSNLGTADYPVTQAVLRNIGVDPDKEVTWSAVGEGTTAGVALDRGAIDGLAYFDTGFGIIENAGIKLRYLPRPPNVPMIGGFFLAARRDFIATDRALCVGFGRSVAMATEFILANRLAGARAFLDMYPGLAARDLTPAEAVTQMANSIGRRVDLYRPPYPGAKLGAIRESELRAEADFYGLKIPDLTPLYTNALIDEINDFDRDKIIAEAKAYKI